MYLFHILAETLHRFFRWLRDLEWERLGIIAILFLLLGWIVLRVLACGQPASAHAAQATLQPSENTLVLWFNEEHMTGQVLYPEGGSVRAKMVAVNLNPDLETIALEAEIDSARPESLLWRAGLQPFTVGNRHIIPQTGDYVNFVVATWNEVAGRWEPVIYTTVQLTGKTHVLQFLLESEISGELPFEDNPEPTTPPNPVENLLINCDFYRVANNPYGDSGFWQVNIRDSFGELVSSMTSDSSEAPQHSFTNAELERLVFSRVSYEYVWQLNHNTLPLKWSLAFEFRACVSPIPTETPGLSPTLTPTPTPGYLLYAPYISRASIGGRRPAPTPDMPRITPGVILSMTAAAVTPKPTFTPTPLAILPPAPEPTRTP